MTQCCVGVFVKQRRLTRVTNRLKFAKEAYVLTTCRSVAGLERNAEERRGGAERNDRGLKLV